MSLFAVLQREATFWNPLPHTGQPSVMSKCFLTWLSIQSLFVWWNVHNWHWYSLPPPGWLIHSGLASAGIDSSGTTTIGREEDSSEGPGWGGLLGYEVTSGWEINVGEIWWHFERISRMGGVVDLMPPGDATVKGELVMPMIGIDVGGGAIGVAVYPWDGWIICLCDSVLHTPVANKLISCAAGEPRRATSNCWMMSAWSSSTMLFMWLANQIFCKA